MDKTGLFAFLNQHRYGVLGTVNVAGLPESALVGIGVTANLEIVFDTLRTTRKYANLTARSDCSFSIGWSGEQTVQYEGVARELVLPDDARYQQSYFLTWPDGPAREHWPGLVYFVVRPQWIRYSDYDQQPPEIREFRW